MNRPAVIAARALHASAGDARALDAPGQPGPRRRHGHRLAGILVAAGLAVALGFAPQAARPVLAAGTLRVAADASYTLDPTAGRVHVEVDVTATSLKPNSGSFVYFYRSLGFPLQPEATGVRVSGGASSVTTTRHTTYVEAMVRLRANLYYRQTTHFTMRFDLVGGAPRSTSPVRVGKAFSTFGVWAWGDVGRSSVDVRVPAEYSTTVQGGELNVSHTPTGDTLSALPSNPDTFFAIVSAERLDAYRETRISLDGGVEIVLLAWPEDAAWSRSVDETLQGVLPELRRLIGLPWPVTHDLDVRERYTPALEGYAGIFFADDQHIDVSEDLDPLVITHETSHAWFNQDLFSDRWIYEGLAEEYAWRTLDAIGGTPGPAPSKPDLADPGYVSLGSWTFPRVIRDQTTDDRERYGYQAAFWVVHGIVDVVGVDRMRAAFAAAESRLTAYPGAGPLEQVDGANDWRRLLDLVSPIDEPEPPGVESRIIDYAVTITDAKALLDRRIARQAYRALVDRGAGWLPPWSVREPMGDWAFTRATTAMDEASAVLDLRDRVATAAGALGLTPDGALRTAYEGAKESIAGASTIANAELAALAAIATAKAQAEASPDLVTQVGLLGATPRAGYDAARAAFEAGQLDQAGRSAQATTDLLAAAPAIGRDRIVAIGGAAVVLLLLLLVVWLALRRRRSARRALAPATATLAADPPVAPAPAGTVPPDVEGGYGSDDAPADP
jgi:hypothetical protein